MAWWWTVLLRLAYVGVANVFALLRLLPMSSRDKDAEILALRHQLLSEDYPHSLAIKTSRADRCPDQHPKTTLHGFECSPPLPAHRRPVGGGLIATRPPAPDRTAEAPLAPSRHSTASTGTKGGHGRAGAAHGPR